MWLFALLAWVVGCIAAALIVRSSYRIQRRLGDDWPAKVALGIVVSIWPVWLAAAPFWALGRLATRVGSHE